MKRMYCDCFSGISGDMFLGALLDAGLPLDYLQTKLKTLNLDEKFQLSIQKVMKGAIQASLLKIDLEPENHDLHHHEHPHDHHHDHHAHRNLAIILDLIQTSSLESEIKNTSSLIFTKLAEAEAKVHGTTINEVHFHEVGAFDSILDIVGAAIGLHYFGIEEVYSSPVPWFSGKTMSQHGVIPLPAPATLELMQIANMPIVPSSATAEMVTPTGAAILAALATFEQPEMKISAVGIGAGSRDLEWPNILRIVIGESSDHEDSQHVLLETNIDDMTAEQFGYVMSSLFDQGALDVSFTPIYMKKNRPATQLNVIARTTDEKKMAEIILAETSTFGVRVLPVKRYEADRKMETVTTEFGNIAIKLKILNGQTIQFSPEYEDVARLAKSHQVDFQKVYFAAQEVYAKKSNR
ncbi:MAG: nickel pincer cofactor biosynthesis protein LarC [Anaerolineaceae bacterium]